MKNLLVSSTLSAFILTVLSACGGGSGANSAENVNTNNSGSNTPAKVVYSGPEPSSADVQRFKQALWDKLVEPERGCYSCHGDENPQSTQFVRADDINQAHALTLPLVDLTTPSNSPLVAKMAEGHNCWRDAASACAADMENFISNWANGNSGSSTEITLSAPPLKSPGSSKSFPNSSASFAATVHPLLTQYCSGCHTDTAASAQPPYFASANPDAAYEVVKNKIDLQNPEQSRLVVRLFPDPHGNCWEGNCQSSAQLMLEQVQAFVDSIPTTAVDPDLLISGAMTLLDGIPASSGGRIDTHAVALYEFKTGEGSKAYDNSGTLPALDLQLSGDFEWVGGFGVRFGANGKAQGTVANSRKIHERILASGEYSIEAWAAPANVTQEGPARIVSYSANTTERNFTLGQTLYSYNFLHRSSSTDQNGEPDLSTSNAAELLQANLQHVVVTYSPVDGRKIYVNGQHSGDLDSQAPGNLNDWNDTYAFVLGNETSSNRPWSGVLKLVAVHDKALEPTTIEQNFAAGVGEKFYLMFDISNQINVAQSYVVFEVSQFDSYSYLFNEPFFASLTANANLDDIQIQGMRIGINGQLAPLGQAFQNLNVTLDTQAYNDAEQRLPLSRLGAVLPKGLGEVPDEFFLSFERIGEHENIIIEADPTPPTVTLPTVEQSDIGLKTFAQINADMAAKTRVSMYDHADIKSLYETVEQQLPGVADIEGFLSSQQMAITQLAIKYCNQLIEDSDLQQSYFPGLNLDQAPAQAFNNSSLLIQPLLTNMVNTSVSNQPSTVQIQTQLDDLVNQLSQCSGDIICNSERSKKIAKASCAAVLGSAITLLH